MTPHKSVSVEAIIGSLGVQDISHGIQGSPFFPLEKGEKGSYTKFEIVFEGTGAWFSSSDPCLRST